MRRYYEAQSRVSQTAAGPSSSTNVPSASPPTDGSGSRSSAQFVSASNQPPMPQSPRRAPATTSDSSSHSPHRGSGAIGGLMSAEQEKEMMRRRYDDAQRAVNMKTVLGSIGHQSEEDHTDRGTIESDFASSSNHAGSSRQHQRSSAAPEAFPSADEEKEMMRQRYEDAVRAMENARLGGYPTDSMGSSTSRNGYDRSETPILREGKGKAVAITNPEPSQMAPPVLPPRPPGEYRELLTPVIQPPVPMGIPPMFYADYPINTVYPNPAAQMGPGYMAPGQPWGNGYG